MTLTLVSLYQIICHTFSTTQRHNAKMERVCYESQIFCPLEYLSGGGGGRGGINRERSCRKPTDIGKEQDLLFKDDDRKFEEEIVRARVLIS